MSDHRRKTLRSFYCEEQLWQAFDKKSRELDATIDQLLNDALRQYLNGPAEPQARPAAPPRPPTGSAPAVEGATMSMPAVPRRPPTRPAGPPAPPSAPSPPVAAPGPPPPPRQTGAVASLRPGAMPPLFVHYNGQTLRVDKENFVIGRGSQGTDLMIRDNNISRKHACVTFHSGAFYMQDLGSTNGVEFNGQKINAKKIEEGDMFRICEHEIHFSYRG